MVRDFSYENIERNLTSLSRRDLLTGVNSSHILTERAEVVYSVLTFQDKVAKLQHNWTATGNSTFVVSPEE